MVHRTSVGQNKAHESSVCTLYGQEAATVTSYSIRTLITVCHSPEAGLGLTRLRCRF